MLLFVVLMIYLSRNEQIQITRKSFKAVVWSISINVLKCDATNLLFVELGSVGEDD